MALGILIRFNSIFRTAQMATAARAVISLAASGCLVACGGPAAQFTATTSNVPSENALALTPPGGPAVLNVVERRFTNGVEQDVALFTSATTPGQNFLRVAFHGLSDNNPALKNEMSYRPVTTAAVWGEMRSQFPGVRMTRSSVYVQNSYGPFSYATGHGQGSDVCLYAWQQIRSPELSNGTFQNLGMIQVRLRLCEANATEQKLLAVMYRITINGTVSSKTWNPYGEPEPVDPSLGRTGHPVYPIAPTDETLDAMSASRPAPIARPTTIARPVIARPRTDRRESEPTMPVRPANLPSVIVPPPSGTAATQNTNTVVVPAPACIAGLTADKTPCR